MIDLNDPRNEYLITHPHFLQGVQHGADSERARIIALLEAMDGQGTIQTYVHLNGKDEPSPSSVYIDRPRAIALIKGENK